MKMVFVLVSLFGLAAGPGHFFYTLLLSGTAHESVILYEADVVAAPVMGVRITKSTGGQWHTPVSLKLSPDLNPIRLGLSCRYVKPVSLGHVRSAFHANLKSTHGTIWEQDINLRAKAKKEGK